MTLALPHLGAGDSDLSWLVGRVADLLGVPVELVDPDAPLFELGLDSVTAVELTEELRQRFEVSVPDTLLYEHPSPRAAIGRLLGGTLTSGVDPRSDASLPADVPSRCVRITGSLTVTGLIPDTLSTREPYNRVLRTVDGDVLIERNRVLTSLRGAFPGLVSVGGDVRVVDTGLVYLTGFESLSTVDGTVLVVDNARMLGFGDGVVTAFSALLSVGGESIFMFVRAISMTSCVFCQQARW